MTVQISRRMGRWQIGGVGRAVTATWPVARLAGPLVAFFSIQSLCAVATLAVIGRLGEAELAGVGAANAVFGLALALTFGVDTAVQARTARAVGAGRPEALGQVLMDGLAVSAPLGAVLAATLWTSGPWLVAALLPDPAAKAAGGDFLRAIAPSLVLYAVTIPMNALWIGVGRPGVALLVTALAAPVQVGGVIVMALGLGLGAAGGGWAVVLAMACAAGLQAILVLRLRPFPGLTRAAPSRTGVRATIAVGWPISLQQGLLQLGLMAAFAILARLGTEATAVVNVLVGLSAVPVQAAIGVGVAAATLVGQALGRADLAEARRWGWRSTALAAVATAPLGLVAIMAPKALLSLFLHDPTTIAHGLGPARIAGLAVVADSAGKALNFALRGAGATKAAAAAPFAGQWLVQLPLTWAAALVWGWGIFGVVAVQACVVAAEALALAFMWADGGWPGGVGVRAAAAPRTRTIAPRRVTILGGAGAGKSRLAREIGVALGLPVIHLDRLVYAPGWRRRDMASVCADLEPSLATGAWVVDGIYRETSPLVLPRAELVIWLDQPAWLRLWRSWRKTQIRRNAPRADRPDGCDERFGWRYLLAILSFGTLSPTLGARLEDLAGQPVLRLSGDRAVNEWLRSVRLEQKPVESLEAIGSDDQCSCIVP